MAPRTETNRSLQQSPIAARDHSLPQVRPIAQALAAIGLALPIGASWAATIVVNSALDTTGDPAICTLRDAIVNANADAQVGTGCVAGTGADLITFNLSAGTVISLNTPLPRVIQQLSIDGGAGVVIERSPTAQVISDFRIMEARGLSGAFPFALSNVTLRNGLTSHLNGGGGLRANALSSVTLTNVKLEDSTASQSEGGGAAISAISGDVMLDHVTATNNYSENGGGGVFVGNVGGAITIRESSFNRNNSSGGGGVLLYSLSGSATVSRSEFINNTGRFGAGLTIAGSMPATVETTYIGNNVSDAANGLYVQNSNVVSVVQSWIGDNSGSPSDGILAAVVAFDGSNALQIRDTTIGPNSGSAIYAYNTRQLSLENSTVSGHADPNVVAAISVENNTATTQVDVRHSTISNNSHGIGVLQGSALFTVTNSILSGNTAGDAVGVGNVVANYSLLGTSVPASGANNIVNNTPGLNPLSTAHNPGRTAGPTANARLIPVHRPLQNSLAVDAGDPAFSSPPSLDQVGNPRVRTGSSGVARLDMGAVETLTPRVSVSNGSALEGTAAPNNVLFTVSLSDLPDPGFDVSMRYDTRDGTAVGGSDYVPRSGTLAFSSSGNVVSQIISVPTIADPIVEPDETFALHINNVSNALLAPAANNVTELFAIGTIINDDSATLSIGNASTVEGGNAVFTVALSSPSTNTVTVVYATSGGTAGSGTDFIPSSGTVTFLPGETSKVVAVQTIDDLIVEPTENFTVTLSNPTNATITQATGTGTILDNDFGNSITVVSAGPVTTIYEPAGNCAVTLGVQGVVGLGAGTLVLPNPGIPPVGQSMPYGMQQTELFTCVGGSVNVTVTWPGAFESHWKWGATIGSPTPHWYPITTTPMGPNTVRFTITDGGFGDNDLAANGRIVDPYAAAVAAPVPPVPAGGGWWSGLVAAISALLGAIGLRSLRRRRDS